MCVCVRDVNYSNNRIKYHKEEEGTPTAAHPQRTWSVPGREQECHGQQADGQRPTTHMWPKRNDSTTKRCHQISTIKLYTFNNRSRRGKKGNKKKAIK